MSQAAEKLDRSFIWDNLPMKLNNRFGAVFMQELDVQTVSIIIAAISVVIGVIMSVLSIRNLAKSRRASIFLDFHKQADQEFLEDIEEVVGEWNWSDYEEFLAKYGPTNPKNWAKFIHVSSFFDSMGKLLKENITDAELLPEAMAAIAMIWWEQSVGDHQNHSNPVSISMKLSKKWDTIRQFKATRSVLILAKPNEIPRL